MNNERLGHILLKQGSIAREELDFCLSVQKNNGRQRLGQLLCHYNFTDELSVAKAVACQVGWRVFEGEYVADEATVNLLGVDFLNQHQCFPLRTDQGVVFVVSRTHDTQTTDLIIKTLNHPSSFCVGLQKQLRKALEGLTTHRKTISMDENQSSVGQDGLTQWLENCLNQAVIQSASDIHIEPSQKVIEIRFRIDGVLNHFETLPLKHLPRLVNINFHKSDVTISDFGHFHDARFLHQYLNHTMDIRVSHIPSVHGSALVLRLLDKSRAALELSELGYSPGIWALIQEGLRKPDGMVLVVGPTGCGKTTTLYAILNHLKSIDCKILTVEDPVEIQLPLMTQVQINEKREISFSSSVRAFLRHDPDIILIGEIRDQSTAQEALRAAMTGHQVFSTLHTNRSLDAILRLHDLGLPYLHMADHISMIIAQRLIRKLCPVCKQKQQEVFIAQGCPLCRHGFKGQTVVAEVLLVDDAASELIAHGDVLGLKKRFKEGAYPGMAEDARRLVNEGITSVEEVQRILG
ncbi:MAG: Flp pilus assembly complex ATPase component TadA [Candidatus Omnitrophica bacterium]|nr:Flp pilus assembly complex ATPase component TadA [Candidatus Omnitrophota bacterium]